MAAPPPRFSLRELESVGLGEQEEDGGGGNVMVQEGVMDRFDVRGIGLDPHLARSTINNLVDDGLPAVEVRQGWVTMAPATRMPSVP